MIIDYHNHTRLCKHAAGEIFDYIERAIEKKISQIAFTDHCPLPDNFDLEHRMNEKEMDVYLHWIEDARDRYPEIKILFGIEADYYEGHESYIEGFLKKYNFDIVIMSVHFIRHWPQGNWVFSYDFKDKTHKQIYTEYLVAVNKGISTGLFDVVGHVDIIKQLGHSLFQMLPDEVSRLLANIKNQNMALEINSSGFRKNVTEPYPGFDWLPLLREMNIPLTVGSDAHHPDQVGLQFDNVYQALKKSSLTSIVTFSERKMQPVKLIP